MTIPRGCGNFVIVSDFAGNEDSAVTILVINYRQTYTSSKVTTTNNRGQKFPSSYLYNDLTTNVHTLKTAIVVQSDCSKSSHLKDSSCTEATSSNLIPF